VVPAAPSGCLNFKDKDPAACAAFWVTYYVSISQTGWPVDHMTHAAACPMCKAYIEVFGDTCTAAARK
jgi:hypothetical protein